MPWKKVYETDFVSSFSVTDSGLDANGKPCWQSRFPYGRIVNNGEAGLYADPVLHPGTNPFPIVDGKRRLRSERLPKPLRGLNRNWQEQDYFFSAALMNSKNVVQLNNGSRADITVSCPSIMKKGYWPGVWAIPADEANTWPPEIDVMEWWLANEGDKPNAFWNSAHNGTKSNVISESKQVVLSDLGIQGDMSQPLTFQLQIWSKEIIVFVNDKEVSRRPNHHPGLPRYILLDVAVGGDPWPGAPDAKTPFPQDMTLHGLKVYQMA